MSGKKRSRPISIISNGHINSKISKENEFNDSDSDLTNEEKKIKNIGIKTLLNFLEYLASLLKL